MRLVEMQTDTGAALLVNPDHVAAILAARAYAPMASPCSYLCLGATGYMVRGTAEEIAAALFAEPSEK